MDFELNDEQKLLRDTTKDLLARSYDAEKRNAIIDSDPGWSPQVWKQLAEVGLLGLTFSEDDGGMDAGPVEIGAVMTEIGRRLAPEPLLDAVVTPGGLISEGGSAEQRSSILPGVPRAPRSSRSPTRNPESVGRQPNGLPRRPRSTAAGPSPVSRIPSATARRRTSWS